MGGHEEEHIPNWFLSVVDKMNHSRADYTNDCVREDDFNCRLQPTEFPSPLSLPPPPLPPPSPSSDKAACTALYNYVIAYYSIESSQLSQVSSEEVP